MGNVAIRAERLSKQYRITSRRARYYTLRETLAERARALWRGNHGGPGLQTIWALRDVSLEVKRGEVVGVVGRNGAGKSTLLKILSRVVEPTAGWADIYGRVDSLLEVGTGFHPELTGRENVYFNAGILGMRRGEIERKFDDIVTFAEVEAFIDTAVKYYSSGMYMRLAFAVAAHLEPEILLADEVLAVGDTAFQDKCLKKIREARRSGRTVVLVSHQMNHIGALCDWVVWLDGGRVREMGSAADVVGRYMAALGGYELEGASAGAR